MDMKGGFILSYENVKLWFAKDENNNLVTIDEISENNTYHCPVCGSDLKPKATKSKRITPHFAHIDASKCNSETMIHWWFKHKFIEKGDKFTVVSDKEREFVCKDVLVEQSYEVIEGVYRPDVTILTECGNTIYFEMAFSNKKQVKDYLDAWLELRNIVVEIDIKQLMFKDNIPAFKALFFDGKCFNTKRNDTYYNVIGKYKEEKLNGNVDEKLKERIRKLDWFWNDLLRYKNYEITDDELIELINLIDIKDIELVISILKKQRCSNIYELFIRKRCEFLENYIIDLGNERNAGDMFKITKREVVKYNRLQTIEIDVYYRNNRSSTVLDVLKMSYSGAKSRINNDINNFVISKKLGKIEKYFNNKYNYCVHFEIIDSRTVIFKVINSFYKNNFKFLLQIPDDVFKSNNSEMITNFIDGGVSEMVRGLSMPIKGEDVFELFDRLISNYEGLVIRKKSIIKSYEVTHSVKIDYKPVKEGVMIELRLYGLPNSNCELIIPFEKMSNKEMNIILSDLNSTLFDSIVSLIIKYDSNYKCCNCENEIQLTKGEIEFYLSKGFESPKRCKPCRDKRKQISK